MTAPVLKRPSFARARRVHVADDVFEQLAAAILRGEMAADSALPPERVLSEQFGVSRLLARQAVHRLAELGLVRVRQGGATTVLDPRAPGDLRVLEILYRIKGASAIDPRDIVEKQLLQGLSLIEVASRRASASRRARISKSAEQALSACVSESAYVAFEEKFWRDIAAVCRNRIFEMEVAWWYRVLQSPPRAERFVPSPLALRVAFYRELAKRFASGRDVASFYLAGISPLLAAIHHRQSAG